MKKFATFLAILIAARVAIASESALTTTYQPLDGLGSGVITVVQVTCHHWYAMSSVGSAIDLIDIRNVPPTDNPTQANIIENLLNGGDEVAQLKVAVPGEFVDARLLELGGLKPYPGLH